VRPARVCVIDDYADNRVLITAVLENAGMEVLTAEDGVALDALLLSGADPDLFLIDLSLPGEDGTSILARLRREPRWAQRPMLALTAHAMAGDADRGLDAGFDAYVTKPIDVTAFVGTVAQFLPSARAHGPENPS
jgi:two-component system, cell cycle response regulator DivK